MRIPGDMIESELFSIDKHFSCHKPSPIQYGEEGFSSRQWYLDDRKNTNKRSFWW